MRVLVTADLHFNHRHSRPLAERVIDEMNAVGGDVLLVVGDTAAGDTDAIEQCLSGFRFDGPKLFVAGNHELWTLGPDSHRLFTEDLPRRIESLGWRWLQTDPFIADDIAIVGSVGWYDYSFAVPQLEIPRRFYERGISPGAAERLSEFAPLLEDRSDISEHAMQVVARWNDAKFVKLHRRDTEFLDELLEQLRAQLESLRTARHVVAAVHHVPLPELLPPHHGAQWDFARAYLGSNRIGNLLREYDNVQHLVCGHSHYPIEAQIGSMQAINLGSGYRQKMYRVLEI